MENFRGIEMEKKKIERKKKVQKENSEVQLLDKVQKEIERKKKKKILCLNLIGLVLCLIMFVLFIIDGV